MYFFQFCPQTMHLNASDDRGIEMIRAKVKGMCEAQSMKFQNAHDPNPELPKLIILDEADMMTKPAQLALRRIMEDFSAHARFIIICNYLNQIVSAIQSRCQVYRLNMLAESEVRTCVRRVCAAENLEIEESAEKAIAELAKGDLRKVLNLLQSASRLAVCGSSTTSSSTPVITEAEVYQFSSEPSKIHVAAILEALFQLEFKEALAELTKILTTHHYSVKSLLEVLYRELLLIQLPFQVRVHIVPVLADLQIRLELGAGQGIALAAIVGCFMNARAQASKLFQHWEKARYARREQAVYSALGEGQIRA